MVGGGGGGISVIDVKAAHSWLIMFSMTGQTETKTVFGININQHIRELGQMYF